MTAGRVEDNGLFAHVSGVECDVNGCDVGEMVEGTCVGMDWW